MKRSLKNVVGFGGGYRRISGSVATFAAFRSSLPPKKYSSGVAIRSDCCEHENIFREECRVRRTTPCTGFSSWT